MVVGSEVPTGSADDFTVAAEDAVDGDVDVGGGVAGCVGSRDGVGGGGLGGGWGAGYFSAGGLRGPGARLALGERDESLPCARVGGGRSAGSPNQRTLHCVPVCTRKHLRCLGQRPAAAAFAPPRRRPRGQHSAAHRRRQRRRRREPSSLWRSALEYSETCHLPLAF